jgi:hypothetical protein
VGETLGEAHARAFPQGPSPAEYDRWILRLFFYGVPVWVPNPPAHGAALRLHDLHHVLTGYDTGWIGEAELGAFEVGSGCGLHVGALPFDVAALGMGLAIAPLRTFRAYVRGRRAKNLFARAFDASLLERPIEEVRRDLALDEEVAPRAIDAILFALWSAAGIAFYAFPGITIPLGVLMQLAPAPRRG